ncbi:hypothetical protein [Salicola sp. Rm-C-2C1-2]|uniref:hypothetical protein n=1 Tax=Salicola sp. Rm-C-2C1-2 TaxID=3141321 RepID=UPI0032E453E2
MLTALRDLWHKHRFLCIAFIAALVVTAFFALRLVVFSLYWADPAHQDQPLEEWMTPRYVALSYDLPVGVVREVLEIEAVDAEPRTLEDIVATSELTVAEIQQRINEAVRSHEGRGQ